MSASENMPTSELAAGLGVSSECDVDEEGREPAILEPFDPKKVSIETKPLTWTNLITRLRKKTILLAPVYQRREVWDFKRKSQLIESLLLNIPIPMFYVAADELGNFEVVDGLQRLSALRDFVFPEGNTDAAPSGEGYPLSGLEFLGLEGKTFAALDDFYMQRLEETTFTFTIIGPGTPEEVKFHIFSRINRGGLTLSDQEVRHALYNGPASILLQELSESDLFRTITSASFKHDNMDDREVILRMLAFMIRPPEFFPGKGKKMGDFLSETMLIINAMPSFTLPRFRKKFDVQDIQSFRFRDVETLRSAFYSGLEHASQLFGKHAFRKSLEPDKRNRLNKALFDTWGSTMACMDEQTFRALLLRRSDIFENYNELMNESTFSRAISNNALEKDGVTYRFNSINSLCENRVKQ